MDTYCLQIFCLFSPLSPFGELLRWALYCLHQPFSCTEGIKLKKFYTGFKRQKWAQRWTTERNLLNAGTSECCLSSEVWLWQVWVAAGRDLGRTFLMYFRWICWQQRKDEREFCNLFKTRRKHASYSSFCVLLSSLQHTLDLIRFPPHHMLLFLKLILVTLFTQITSSPALYQQQVFSPHAEEIRSSNPLLPDCLIRQHVPT